ncbi:CLM2 protein, partial [Paradoxornis webbianus]|nr:CLM2 protein [Sinosuthora webbiana]
LLLLLLLLLRTCNRLQSQTLRRREGDTLYIKCPYTQSESGYTKLWCLLEPNGVTREVASTYYRSTDKRITIKDDPSGKTVSVTVTDLRAEDSGTYSCAFYSCYNLIPRTEISLNVFKAHILGVFQGPSSTQSRSRATSLSNGNTLIVLSVVLFVLLLLALLASIALGVRHYKLLRKSGNREAEDTGDRAEGTAQPGSTGRRGSSQDDTKGPAYINLDVQSQPRPEDPLYCNVEPGQAHRSPQHVEYAVIAFNQSPRNGRE